MTIYAAPGESFEAVLDGAPSGSVGTLGVRISNPVTETDIVARTTSGIAEYPASSGIYFAALIAPSTAGAYSVVWDDTSTFVQEELHVTSSAFSPAAPTGADLCTVADVVLAAGVPDDTRDDIIQACVTAASLRLAHRYQREFAPVAGTPTRRFEFTSLRVNLAPRDLRSVSEIVLDPDGSAVTLAATDYRLRPAQSVSGTYYVLQLRSGLSVATASSRDFGSQELDITGAWGFPTIPGDVTRAAVLTAASWIDRAVAAYGIDSDGAPGGVPPDFASTWDIPFAAHTMCKPFARVVV